MIEQESTDPPRGEGHQLKSIYRALAISPETYRRWERGGFAPRRGISSGRWGRVSRIELQRWLDQLALDRRASGKAWLKHPLKPLSWASPPAGAEQPNN